MNGGWLKAHGCVRWVLSCRQKNDHPGMTSRGVTGATRQMIEPVFKRTFQRRIILLKIC